MEIILPDPTFIEEHAEDILGIVLTHAHEDHIGAVGWLWPRLKAPLYATPFTAFLLREKLREKGLLDKVRITEIPLDGSFSLGPFDLTLLTLTHSIPEPNGVAIRTPLGNGVAHRRLEDRSGSVDRSGHRRGRHPPAGRRGRAGHGL